jgi:hypothetical protein
VRDHRQPVSQPLVDLVGDVFSPVSAQRRKHRRTAGV